MKRVLIITAALCFSIVSIIGVAYKKPVSNPVLATPKGFAVVELFTSEGCSSCPPADKAVAELLKEYPEHVYVLGFHVDYWNYLGWKDEFSSVEYTNRQQDYASVLKLNSIYTPQVIVNGQTECTGSDKKKLFDSVQEELAKDSPANIFLSAKSSKENEVTISCKTSAAGQTTITVALVQLQALSMVKRGENRGKELHHINVVRALKTIDKTGSTTLDIPPGLSPKECKIIAFAQRKTDLHITAAAACIIQ